MMTANLRVRWCRSPHKTTRHMTLPNSILRSRLWSASTCSAQLGWVRLQIHLQLQRSDGWMPAADVPRCAGVSLEALGSLLERCGEMVRPVGYPVAEIQRIRKASEVTSTRNKAQCIGAPVLQCSSALVHWEMSADQNGSETTENEGNSEENEDSAKKVPPHYYKDIYTKALRPKALKNKELSSGSGGIVGSGILKGEGRGGEPETLPEWLRDIAFLVRGGGTRRLTPEEYGALLTTSTESQLRAEIPEAALWLVTNPFKRKTAAGLLSFLAGWMRRAKEKRPGIGSPASPSGKSKPRNEWAGTWRVGK